MPGSKILQSRCEESEEVKGQCKSKDPWDRLVTLPGHVMVHPCNKFSMAERFAHRPRMQQAAALNCDRVM